jgi:hypothetical protein
VFSRNHKVVYYAGRLDVLKSQERLVLQDEKVSRIRSDELKYRV